MINNKKNQQRTLHAPLTIRTLKISVIQSVSGLQLPKKINIFNNKWCETTSKALTIPLKNVDIATLYRQCNPHASYHFNSMSYVDRSYVTISYDA